MKKRTDLIKSAMFQLFIHIIFFSDVQHNIQLAPSSALCCDTSKTTFLCNCRVRVCVVLYCYRCGT